jgi:CRP-like cAMP-binding protein
MKARFGPSNRTAGKFCLPMKKQDIAAYLGLTSETLSRNLKYLERQNIIQNATDGITLLQRPEWHRVNPAQGA